MRDKSTPLSELVISALAEIADGKCSITDEMVLELADDDMERARVLSALHMLHETLEYQKQEARREREAAVKANQAKSLFLARMSHEIRTPMNGVLGMARILSETQLSKEQDDCVQTIAACGESLMTLLNDVLDLSKIEAGGLTIESRAMSLFEMVRSMRGLFKVQAERKGLELAVKVGSDVPPWVNGDSTRLRQILINLVGNAIKFTPQGKVSLHIEPADQTHIKFSVIDTGIGMTPEAQARIFKAFEQADDSTTRRFGGTGLGVTISNQLVELMGGTLEVNSTPDRGTRFSFVLPMPVASKPATHKAQPNKRNGPAKFRGHALLAEDNRINQVVAKKELQKLGLAVTVANDGQQAVDTVLGKGGHTSPHPFDVIFLDFEMPRLNGVDAARTLRAADVRTPIVAMTAHAVEGYREQCLASGMNDYIAKPIGREHLREILSKLLTASDVETENDPT